MNNKIKKLTVALLVLSPIVFLNAQNVVEAIVAVVNDDIITLSDYKKQYESFYQAMQAQFEGEELSLRLKELREQLLDTMITDLLLIQEARKNNMDVSEQLGMMIQNLKEENGFESDEQLRQAMARQGINYDAWRKQQEDYLLKQSVIFVEVGRNIVVDDTEIVNYYRQNQDEFIEPEEVALRAIYVSEEDKTSEEAQAKKDEITAKLESGEDFASLAGQYSEGPEKDSQGSLGTFKKGELEENLYQAVEKLEVGGISPWLQVRGGWYLILLENRTASYVKAFDDVKEEVERKLFEEEQRQKTEEYLESMKNRSFIKILIPNPLEE